MSVYTGYQPCKLIFLIIKLTGRIYHKKCYAVYRLCPQKHQDILDDAAGKRTPNVPSPI